MKKLVPNSTKLIAPALCLLFALVANRAGAALAYWDNNGASTPGSGTWDTTSLYWATSSTLTASPGTFPSGAAAVFCAGSTPLASATITVNTPSIVIGGIYDNGVAGSVITNLTLNASGGGSLSLNSGQCSFDSSISAVTITVNAPLTGAGQVYQQGNGSLALYGINSFTGGVGLTGGQVIYYNNNSSLGTGVITVGGTGNALVGSASTNVTIANNFVFPTAGYLLNLAGGNPVSGVPGTIFSGTFTLPSSGTTTLETSSTATEVTEISGVISGASALTIADNGTLVLAGANTYSGLTTISSPATLRQGAANALPFGAGKGGLTVASGATFDLGGFDCSINGFTGTSAGTIDNKEGTGTYTLTIGNNGGGGTQSGVIKNSSGTLALAKVSTGQITLSGANSYSGTITISGGKLQINNDNRLGAVPGSPVANEVTLNNGGIGVGLRVNGNVTFSANRGITVIGNGGSVEATTAVTAKYPGIITGNGNFASGGGYTAGYGTNLLSGANNYTGTTTIDAGTLRLGATGTLPYGTPLTIGADNNTGGGAALDMGGFDQTIGPLASSTGFGGIGTDTPTIILSGNLTVLETNINTAFAGQIVDGGTVGSLTISGNAALTLSGINTYSGPTTISSGELLGATGGSCANTTVTVADGATNGVSITDNTMQWTCANLTYNSGAPVLDFNFGYSVTPSTSVAPLIVSGAVAFNGTPTVTIEAANLPTGTYPLMTWGSTSGTAPTTVILPPHVTGSLSVSGNTLNLVVSANTEPLEWTGTTSSTWDVNVPTDLNWKDNTATATYYQQTALLGDAVIFDDTYITADQNITLNSVVTPASLTISNNLYNYTIGGTGGIAGSIGLTKLGSGTATLNFANSYTGPTTIEGGTLSIGTDADLGAVPAAVTAASIVLSNAALSANTTLTLSNNRGITMLDNSTLDVASGQTLNYGGVIAGPFDLTKTGPGTYHISNNQNSYSGRTIISAGVLQTGGDRTTPGAAANLGAVPTSPTPDNIILGGGTLQGNNPNFAFNPNRGITLTADSGLSALTNNDMGIQGPITGNYGLTVSCPGGPVGTNGVVYLEGTNTYTGNTVISTQAVLSLFYSGSISNSASISIAAGAGLDVSSYTNDSGAYAFSLADGQSLIASGFGTTTTFNSANAAVLNGNASGTVSLGSNPITLNYTPINLTGDATSPSLYVAQGTLVLNGNAFTVNNMAASPLGAGTYVLIQQASGTITSAGSYSVSVTGMGLAAGTTASISVSGGSVNLDVVSAVVPQPGINSVMLSGTNLIFSGTNGPASGTFYVLASTNVALPLIEWTPIVTNTFGADGSFNVTNAVGVDPSQFFLIEVPAP